MARQAAEKPFQAVIPSPFAVILIPQSREKDLRISLRVNSARNLALSVFKPMRDSSSSRGRGTPRNDTPNESLRSLKSLPVVLSVDSRKRLSVKSGRRREAGAIEALKAKVRRYDVRESARSLSC